MYTRRGIVMSEQANIADKKSKLKKILSIFTNKLFIVIFCVIVFSSSIINLYISYSLRKEINDSFYFHNMFYHTEGRVNLLRTSSYSCDIFKLHNERFLL